MLSSEQNDEVSDPSLRSGQASQAMLVAMQPGHKLLIKK
jgi:hypothetical protein